MAFDSFVTIGFDGLAYGMLLFLMAGGLSITMGLMGFANLAHGAFGMAGGYAVVGLMSGLGWPFLATLPAATLVGGVLGAVLERGLLHRFYRASEVDQVLLSIGLVFISAAVAAYFAGLSQARVVVPAFLEGQLRLGGMEFGVYRLFLIAVGTVLTVALMAGIDHTTFGAKVRAAVDNRRMATSCGIPVGTLFTAVFSLGSGLAALGGALSINVVGLDPNFPIRYMVYLLIIVVVGGLGSMRGTLLAALMLGFSDMVLKYYAPHAAAFTVYLVTIGVLLWRPRGLLGLR